MRARADRAARWLRADVGSTVRFEPAGAAQRPSERSAVDLPHGLSRWRRRVSRRRAVVLVRRHLLVALVADVVIEAVIALAGGDRRSAWLLVPLGLALASVGILLARRVTTEQTAYMLDDGLELRDRVGTALELSTAPASDRAEASDGRDARAALQTLVEREAARAVAQSFRTARLRVPRASVEWSAVLGAAAVLALLMAFTGATRSGTTTPGARGGSALSAGRAGASHRGRPGRVGPPLGTPPRAPTASLPSAFAPSRQGESVNPYVPTITAQQLRREGIASARNAGTKEFQTIHSSQPGGVAGQAGEAGTKPNPSGSSEALPSHTGAGSGGLGSPTKVPAGATGLSTSPTSGTSGKGRGAAGSSPGHAGAATTGSQGGAQGGKAPPGGGPAGSARGSSALGPGLAPEFAPGTVGLPLQAGYAPSTSKQAPKGEGTSQTPNGGGGAGRSAQSQGAAGGGGTSFPVLAPTSGAAPAADQTQVTNYFGAANQLDLGSW